MTAKTANPENCSQSLLKVYHWMVYFDRRPAALSKHRSKEPMSGTEGAGKSKSQPKKNRVELCFQYPRHALEPEDLLDFIEFPYFIKRWEQLGLDDEDDKVALQLMIMANP